jgi:acyl carrier protein
MNPNDDLMRTVLQDVSRMIRETIGEAWAEDVPIGMTTSFSNDLELESIEFVDLAERLRGAYGAEVDFAGWLATMELKEILALDVGRLVEFIARCTSKRATA